MDYNGHRIITLERELEELEELKNRGGRGLAAAIEERRIELDRRQVRAYIAADDGTHERVCRADGLIS